MSRALFRWLWLTLAAAGCRGGAAPSSGDAGGANAQPTPHVVPKEAVARPSSSAMDAAMRVDGELDASAGSAAPGASSGAAGGAQGEIVLAERAVMETGVRARVAGTPLAVTVEETGLPRGTDRRHRLFVRFLLEDGAEQARFTPEPDESVVWHGYRVAYGIAVPSHAAPKLWLRVERDAPR